MGEIASAKEINGKPTQRCIGCVNRDLQASLLSSNSWDRLQNAMYLLEGTAKRDEA